MLSPYGNNQQYTGLSRCHRRHFSENLAPKTAQGTITLFFSKAMQLYLKENRPFVL